MIAPPPAPARRLARVDDAELWCADLDLPGDDIRRMLDVLEPAERARAEALRDTAQRRYVAGRATLRLILGEAGGMAPDRLRFSLGPDGKPSLAPRSGATGPQFNVSHSNNVFLIAITRGRAVGVDVEWTGGSSAFEGVARRFFSEAERTWLDRVPAAGRREAFFRIWVRKEAYLKGRGEGISQWIYGTDFSTLDGGPATPKRDQDRWLVRDIDGLPDGYLGSIALAREAS